MSDPIFSGRDNFTDVAGNRAVPSERSTVSLRAHLTQHLAKIRAMHLSHSHNGEIASLSAVTSALQPVLRDRKTLFIIEE